MNKSELIRSVGKRSNLGTAEAAAAVDAFVDTVVRAVNRGETITIEGFGVFERRQRAARKARNIRTGEVVKVRAHKAPAFRPSPQFKAIVTGAQKLPRTGMAVSRGGLTVGRNSTVTVASRTKGSSSTAAASTTKTTASTKTVAGRTTTAKKSGKSAAKSAKHAATSTAKKPTRPRAAAGA
ncbi:HU family DNA-binding protein [Gordonia alkanivorans]|uniref:HU family DNA-binding protein n=1 Tax=Gordonia alkanivorans TaxID=84096 RepID=UPI0004BB6AB7|nr:HU family DNA-binding protein [Gordonia alkanivorans]